MTWKDEATIKAVQQYLRILTGLIFFILLMVLILGGRVDIDTLLKAMLGTLVSDRIGQAVIQGRH